MTTTHEVTVHGKCPINSNWDYYTLLVSTDEMMRVEEIEELCDFCRGRPWTQEEMTKQLRAIFPHHCKLQLVGRHSQNTKTTCEA